MFCMPPGGCASLPDPSKRWERNVLAIVCGKLIEAFGVAHHQWTLMTLTFPTLSNQTESETRATAPECGKLARA